MVGFLHMIRFGRDRHYLRGGYQFDYDDTDGRNYTYVGHRFLFGAQYTLPWFDIRLAYDFDVHYRNYLHTNTVLPLNAPDTRERSDHEYTNIVAGGSADAPVLPRPAVLPHRRVHRQDRELEHRRVPVPPELRRDLLHLAVLSPGYCAAPA